MAHLCIASIIACVERRWPPAVPSELQVPWHFEDTPTIAFVTFNVYLNGAQGEVCKGEVRCVLPSRGLP